jgi:hypothetical protein
MVDRRIAGFIQAGRGEWVAQLSCGHRRTVRHRPPAEVHPWILERRARASHVGTWLPCPTCDEEPEGGELVCYAGLVCPECGQVLDDTHQDH